MLVTNPKPRLHRKRDRGLTNSQVQIRIAENQGESDLARSRKQAEQTVVVADAELARSRRAAEQIVVTAEADSRSRILAGRGEGQRVLQIGISEAVVLLRKIASFGDPRLYALRGVAEELAKQPTPGSRAYLHYRLRSRRRRPPNHLPANGLWACYGVSSSPKSPASRLRMTLTPHHLGSIAVTSSKQAMESSPDRHPSSVHVGRRAAQEIED